MQLTINTRLDAINYIIGCIGLSPVDSEDEYNLDVAMAAQAMDNISRRIQDNRGQGWWFNRERNWLVLPDPVNGEVQVPNNALAVYYIDNYKRYKRMATRGRNLYDTNKYRYDMRPFANDYGYVSNGEGKLNLMLVTQLEFDDLPYTAKDAIATAAGVRFAVSNEMDINRIKILQAQADDSKFALEQENTSQQRNNAFKDNGTMLSFAAIGGGYNNFYD
ncbi:MAG: hypothetical protein [Bacteriophage sp.]|nr:MAG: hypothetical protein [Bacteriophage sp.]